MDNQTNGTKEEFIQSVKLLIEKIKNHSDEVENTSLESYLESLVAWTEDMEGYYLNWGKPVPSNISWNVFTDIINAASVYE